MFYFLDFLDLNNLELLFGNYIFLLQFLLVFFK